MAFIEETLGNFIDQKCMEYHNKEVMVFPSENTRYTYQQFHKLYTSLAKGLLSLGIKKNDHVAILSLNSPLWIAFQIAASKIGAVMVCINTGYNKNELAYVLEHSEVNTLLMTSGYKSNSFIGHINALCPELKASSPCELQSERFPRLKNVIMIDNSDFAGTLSLDELINLGTDVDFEFLRQLSIKINAHDVTNIYYTSGTTGNPKAVMLTHFSIVNNALISGDRLNYCYDDRILLCLPLFHVIGYVLSAIAGLFFGVTLVITERFETGKVLKYLEAEQCTTFNGVPTMFNFLLNSENLIEHDLSNLRKGFIAGSCCSQKLMLDIIQTLGIPSIANLYGQTEAIAILQISDSDALEHRISTVGKPLHGIETKIIDPLTGVEVPCNGRGELCVKSIFLMKGYYKNKQATEKTVDRDGWLHTGDLATYDNEGYISIIGRIKDMIIRGGENISPAEIENTLKHIDGIVDAAVVGVPDEVLGEEICAFIITEKNSNINEELILKYSAENMAKYKIPKFILFVDNFPVTSSGKVRKFALKDIAIKECLTNTKQAVLI